MLFWGALSLCGRGVQLHGNKNLLVICSHLLLKVESFCFLLIPAFSAFPINPSNQSLKVHMFCCYWSKSDLECADDALRLVLARLASQRMFGFLHSVQFPHRPSSIQV